MIGYLRVPREVVRNALGWVVTYSEFVTSDRELAEAVRDRLDVVDPVQGPPCPHDGDSYVERTPGDPRTWLICMDCGAERVG